MANGSQSHTNVTNALIIGENTVRISLRVDAFLPNHIVEISGHAAQRNGAFASFSEFKEIGGKIGDTTTLDVDATLAGNSDPFQRGQDVTVFVRMSVVWVTVLGEGQNLQAESVPDYAEAGAAWGKVKGVAGPDSYSSDTQEGNQPASPPVGVGQPGADGPPSPSTG